MASTTQKMDMSLDQIIKLQRKEAKQSGAGSTEGGNRGRGNRIRGRGTGRGRRGRGAGRPATSASRRNENATAVNATKSKKLGLRTNLAARRLLTKGRAVGGRGRGRGVGGTTFQRVAQNIVKRAIVQNRRLAVQQRRSVTGGQQGGGNNTRRLVADVRRWRNTARQLQRALQVQQQQQGQSSRVRLRRFGSAAGARGQQQAVMPITSSVHQRLGWQQTTAMGRGALRRGRVGLASGGRIGKNLSVVKGRGSVGQMQSDLIIQTRRVAVQQQRRQQQENYSRGRRQQGIGQARGLGTGPATTQFNRSQQITVRNRGRRGRGANRFGSRSNEFGTSFSQGGTVRQSLNERFGGSSGPSVRIVSNKGGFRGRRGNRQIFF